MRIWDTFLFNGELDMLECRLRQFENFPVYRHVLCEAAVDHQGHPKPLYYADHRERFAPWADRIVHVIAKLAPAGEPGANPFGREATQREALARGLGDAERDDWLILADVDEIPNAAAMAALAAGQQGVLQMKCCMFYADMLWADIRASVITPAGAALDPGLARARRVFCAQWPAIPGAGHHMTWLGGPDAVRAKLAAHCHTELNNAIGAAADGLTYADGTNPISGQFGFSGPLQLVDVDSSWPYWVAERRCPPSWFRPRTAGDH